MSALCWALTESAPPLVVIVEPRSADLTSITSAISPETTVTLPLPELRFKAMLSAVDEFRVTLIESAPVVTLAVADAMVVAPDALEIVSESIPVTLVRL